MSVRNFKSFGRKQTIDLSHLGLTLLVGHNEDDFQSNGAGKSSLLDAIVYGLYGDVPSKATKSSLINRKKGKNMMIFLSFMSTGNEYHIYRYRKDKEYHNKTLLYRNGKNITQKSVKDTNKYIQSLIGIDMQTYLHSYMFSGTNAKFASLTDSEKKQVLDKMIDVSIYPIARACSKQDAKMAKGKIQQAKSDNVINDTNIKSYQAQKKQSEITYKNRKQFKASLGKQIKLVNTASNKIKSSKDKIVQLEKRISDSQAKFNKYDQYKNKANLFRQGLNRVNSKIDSLGAQSNQEVSSIQDFTKKLVDLSKQKVNHCYWCGQKLNEVQRKHEIIQVAKKLNDHKITNASLKKQISIVAVTYSRMSAQYSKLKKQIPDMSKATKQLSKDNNKLSKYKSTINGFNNGKRLVKDLKSQYHKYTTTQTPEFFDKKIQTRKQMKDNTVKFIQKCTKQYRLYKACEMVYSNHGASSFLLDLVLPFINQQANSYLSVLTHGDISLEIVPTTTSHSTGNTSEKINMKITNNHGSNNYKELSSGEKRRVDLGIILALQDYVLSKSSSRMNICFYDELFDSLDNRGVEDVVNLLKQRSKQFSNIVVVSHNPELQEWFDNKIIITKRNGISTITSK